MEHLLCQRIFQLLLHKTRERLLALNGGYRPGQRRLYVQFHTSYATSADHFTARLRGEEGQDLYDELGIEFDPLNITCCRRRVLAAGVYEHRISFSNIRVAKEKKIDCTK